MSGKKKKKKHLNCSELNSWENTGKEEMGLASADPAWVAS